MAKEDLIAQLNTILNNFTFGIALRCCFPDDRWRQVDGQRLEFKSSSGDSAIVELRPLVNRLSAPQDRIQLFEEYEKSLKRTLLRESHEVILGYSRATLQFCIYRKQPWFEFARIIRNVVSHEGAGILNRWSNKAPSSATWRGRTISKATLGQPIAFAPYEALQLFDDQLRFVKETLK